MPRTATCSSSSSTAPSTIAPTATAAASRTRLRLLLETIDAVAIEIGTDRTGVRISPFGLLADMRPYDDEADTWTTLAAELDRRGHARGLPPGLLQDLHRHPDRRGRVQQRDRGTGAEGRRALDLIAFGKPFVANPDLVERMRNGWPIAEAPRGLLRRQAATRLYRLSHLARDTGARRCLTETARPRPDAGPLPG